MSPPPYRPLYNDAVVSNQPQIVNVGSQPTIDQLSSDEAKVPGLFDFAADGYFSHCWFTGPRQLTSAYVLGLAYKIPFNNALFVIGLIWTAFATVVVGLGMPAGNRPLVFVIVFGVLSFIFSLIYVIGMVFLRRKFVEISKVNEGCCTSCLAVYCCFACTLGQLGAYKKKFPETLP